MLKDQEHRRCAGDAWQSSGTAKRRRRRLAAALSVVAIVAVFLPSSRAQAQPTRPVPTSIVASAGADLVPNAYIVVLKDGDPERVAGEHGRAHQAAVRHVYRHALRGYSARMSAEAARRVALDHRVAWVEQQTREQSLGVPTGVNRSEADRRGVGTTSFTTGTSSSFAPIAIIDSGITRHADLNVIGGRNFTSANTSAWDDGSGHGTHVAGTVGANGGVFGVAPGAPLWAVRVCADGCMSGDIVAGINWVTQEKKARRINFAAANFSISSADTTKPCSGTTGNRKGVNATHSAICNLVDSGVVFVMAAGNNSRVKDPYPEAFSVSAVADFDGRGGAKGAATCRSDVDDTLANFSNYGPRVNIAAPGTCIQSTSNTGGHKVMSGTSMAAPHVTGAVALHLHLSGRTPATTATGANEIKDALVKAALPQGRSNHRCSYDDPLVGGPLLFLNAPSLGGSGTCDDGSS